MGGRAVSAVGARGVGGLWVAAGLVCRAAAQVDCHLSSTNLWDCTCPEAAPVTGAEELWTELSTAVCSATDSCCSTGWDTAAEVGDNCYRFSSEAASFSEAEAVCASLGAQLVHVVDSAQQHFIAQQLFQRGDHPVWLGIRGEDPQSVRWTDGRHSAFSRMSAIRTRSNTELSWPAATAACVKWCGSHDVTCHVGDWDFVRCDETLHYVCQKPSGRPRAYTTWTNTLSNTMTAGDDGWTDLVLPFPFQFFGETFAAGELIRISANGYITFGIDSLHNPYGSTTSFPSAESPNAVIAGFWTDLYPAGVNDGGGLYTLSDTNRLVIEWREIPFWVPYREQGVCNDEENYNVCRRTVTFEMVLHRDGSVQMLYLDCDELPHPYDGYPDHAPLTIGFENVDGTVGVEFFGAESDPYTVDMTGLVITIPQSCHNGLPYCAARIGNASAICDPIAAPSSGQSDGSGSGTGTWTQMDPHSDTRYYRASSYWGPSFALLMSFLVSFWRLYKVITRGHIWRGHWISVENDAATVQAMLAAARAGGRGLGTGGPLPNNALETVEMDSLVRLTPAQLVEPVQRDQRQPGTTFTASGVAGSAVTGDSIPTTAPTPPDDSPALAEGQASSTSFSSLGTPTPEHGGAAPVSEMVVPERMLNFGNDMCAICMCSMVEPEFEEPAGFEADASLVQLTCLHVFHAECAEQWLQRSRECPVCKRDAVHGDGSADREAVARALLAGRPEGNSSSGEDEEAGDGDGISDHSRARTAVAALRGYRSCDRSTMIVCLACVSGLLITTGSELMYVRLCNHCGDGNDAAELDLRCGFFVAISLVSFAMASVAMAAIYTPVHRRYLWDGFCGWCVYSFAIISISSSWYEKVLQAHATDSGCEKPTDSQLTESEKERQEAHETLEVVWILLRFGATLVAFLQLTTARERDLSIRWFLDVQTIVFQATSRGLGQNVDTASPVDQTTVASNQQMLENNLTAGSRTNAEQARPATAAAEVLPSHVAARSLPSEAP